VRKGDGSISRKSNQRFGVSDAHQVTVTQHANLNATRAKLVTVSLAQLYPFRRHAKHPTRFVLDTPRHAAKNNRRPIIPQ
jgi:hypothetical protein